MPWIGFATAGIGLAQAIGKGGQRRKAEKELEALANGQQPNAGILDYYNKALAKYNPNPYTSASFNQQQNQINRNVATGINGLQNRRLGAGAIAGIVQQGNDASARAAANAENMSNQDLARLGQASGMKASEQQRRFDMLYNLKAMKAGQAASGQNAGLQNIFGGLNSAATLLGEYGWDGKKNRNNNPV